MAVAHGVAPAATRETSVVAGTYGFLGFLTLLNALNMLDRNLIVAFANDIKADLHLTHAQYGLLSGIVFTLLYGLISPVMGLIADSTHRPRLAAGGVALWSLLTAVSGAARGFVSFGLPRAFIGVGESALTPTALSLLGDRFPARRMGFASGVYYAGVPLGSGVSYLVAGALGPMLGWRNCFILIGAIGVVLALVLGAMRDPRPRPLGAARSAAHAIGRMLALGPANVAAMMRSPALMLTLLGALLLHFRNGAGNFDTLRWHDEMHLATGPLFLTVAFLSATVGLAGSLLGGLIGDWWLKTTGLGRPMVLALLLVVLIPIGVAFRLTDHAGWLFWLGLSAGIFQGGALYGVVLSTLHELSPIRSRATTVAVFILLVNVPGIGLASTVCGYLIDALAAAGDRTPIGHAQALLAVITGLSIPCFFLAGRWFTRDREALAAFEAAAGAAA
jgi:predicted MFS family arabinose efflux permease